MIATAMHIETWPIGRLIPYDKNPRLNDDAVDAVARSIQEFGFRQPIVVDEAGVIVIGHTRFKAAHKLGLTEVPVHVAVGLAPEKVKALRIADNKTAEIAEWNLDLLPIELAELQGMDFDIGLLGFDQDELAKLLDPGVQEGLCDPDEVPAPPDEAITQSGDLWILGDHRLLCGDSSQPTDLDRLLGGAVIHLCNTDPPYNVKVEPRSNNAIAAGLSSFQGTTHHQKLDVERHPEKAKPTGKKLRAKDRPLANDFVSDEEFDRLLDAWFGNIARVLVPGRGFYIWGGYANCANYPPFLKKHGLYFSQAIIWDKQHPVLTRKDFIGAHEWCQPAETLVQTPQGAVPIASLRTDDRVVSMRQSDYRIIGRRDGTPVAVTERNYAGDLYGVAVEDRTTWCTPGHLWTVRLTESADQMWCTYLMRRGNWWRVGKSELINSWGFGLKQRLYKEDGEEAWVLGLYDSSLDAAIDEQIILAEYGIPTITWSDDHDQKGLRQIDDLRRVYDELDLERMQVNAARLLAAYGRHIDCPLLRSNRDRVKVSRRVATLVRACNLLAGAMEVPVPEGDSVRWSCVRAVDRQVFDGPVYSMDVARWHHYIADGIVTHNCFYGWKEGAAHQYFGPNNATDLWHVKKVNPQSMVHLTEKPVELAVRAMQFSSRMGENVLDLFGGSGSTLIAAQQTGRQAFLMELDPLYCDVIAQRFEQFTGQKGERRVVAA